MTGYTGIYTAERIRVAARARSLVARALKKGELVKSETCIAPGCGGQPEAHHESYDSPLEVLWLCRQHHFGLHADRRNGEPDPVWLTQAIAESRVGIRSPRGRYVGSRSLEIQRLIVIALAAADARAAVASRRVAA